jgi:hypothetical protein
MQPNFEHLLILQDRDLRLRDINAQLERIPRDRAQATERLTQSKAATEAAKLALQENEVAIRNVELDIGTRRETINRLKKQQYETRKNEEYQALGHEVIRYTKEVDGLETTELELMEKADLHRTALAEAQESLARLRKGVDEEIAQLDRRQAALEAEKAEVQGNREAEIAKIDEDLASLYDRLLASRGAPVVVALTPAAQCQGCHVKAISSVAVRVQAGKELVQCENCGRILYSE